MINVDVAWGIAVGFISAGLADMLWDTPGWVTFIGGVLYLAILAVVVVHIDHE